MKLRTTMTVAALGLSGALLAGCGDDNDDQAQQESQTQSTDQSSGDTAAGGNSMGGSAGSDSGNDDATSEEDMASDDSADTDTEDAPAATSEDDEQVASGGEGPAEQVNLIFGTGGTGGSYYPIGGALKSVFEKSDVVGGVQVVATGASVQNINNITDGLNQIAIVMSDVAYDAVEGQNQFDGNPANIQALAGLYPNVVQVVATADSDIDGIEDLAGKRVGVGKVGSGVEQSAAKVLESAGLSYDDLAQVSHTGYADSVTEMSNGNLDAAFFTSGVPNSSITGLMQSTDVTFVPVEGDVASTLLEKYPYYETYEIPADAAERYDLDEAVDTVAIRNIMIVSGDMREDVAEDLTRRFHDYLESDSVSVGALRQFDPNTMGTDLVVPLNPGAESFYATLDGAAAGQDGADGMDGTDGADGTDGTAGAAGGNGGAGGDGGAGANGGGGDGGDGPGAADVNAVEDANRGGTDGTGAEPSSEANAEAATTPADGATAEPEKGTSAETPEDDIDVEGDSGDENAQDEDPQS
ncbi:TAXI family TRAP transporter solute-binding subunit [Salinicola halophilus]|uniref:TAXI family TRAP transporter solute-binding subunit n=1 Tax=Salinicola halophilus TaxID=184065 RepID=UPI001EF96451|nr:TAXI family TRAP transporter solute-binding subunit [Salinicola halophilus]